MPKNNQNEEKQSNHGGKRAGAGRKPSSLGRKSQAIAAIAAATGLTPLEVMIKAMRLHVDAGRWDNASAIAKDAAPYMHPKLASIEHAGKDGGPIELKNITDLDRARALAAFLARTKAVEVK